MESPGVSRCRASGPAQKEGHSLLQATLPPTLLGYVSARTASVSPSQQAWGQPFPALRATLCPAPLTPPTHSEIQPPTAHKNKNYNQKIKVDELQQDSRLL